MAWMITIALQPTMGVAWHRFLAFFNIWFKRARRRPHLARRAAADRRSTARRSTSRTSRSSTRTPRSASARSRTSPGRACSTSPPAPSAVAASPSARPGTPTSRSRPSCSCMALRDHAHAKAPWLLAAEAERDGLRRGRRQGPGRACRWSATPATTSTTRWRPTTRTAPATGRVIDPDVLWSCTTCGACVEQCPVDIEHVDAHRRHAPLPGADRVGVPQRARRPVQEPREQGQPVGHGRPRPRLDWAKDLPFAVKILGQDVESSLTSVDYLFWVGCAGAYEDRAKKTTRAVAELLDTGRRHASPSSATARRAPATRPAAPATSSSSRCSPSRTSRSSTRPAPRRSW